MTPDEHYARAKELLNIADETYEALSDLADRGTARSANHQTDEWWVRQYTELTAIGQLAQAHATLALQRPEEPR